MQINNYKLDNAFIRNNLSYINNKYSKDNSKKDEILFKAMILKDSISGGDTNSQDARVRNKRDLLNTYIKYVQRKYNENQSLDMIKKDIFHHAENDLPNQDFSKEDFKDFVELVIDLAAHNTRSATQSNLFGIKTSKYIELLLNGKNCYRYLTENQDIDAKKANQENQRNFFVANMLTHHFLNKNVYQQNISPDIKTQVAKKYDDKFINDQDALMGITHQINQSQEILFILIDKFLESQFFQSYNDHLEINEPKLAHPISYIDLIMNERIIPQRKVTLKINFNNSSPLVKSVKTPNQHFLFIPQECILSNTLEFNKNLFTPIEFFDTEYNQTTFNQFKQNLLLTDDQWNNLFCYIAKKCNLTPKDKFMVYVDKYANKDQLSFVIKREIN